MTKEPRVRPPEHLRPPGPISTRPEAEAHWPADCGTLLEVVAGLDRLEQRLETSPVPQASAQRGYFTPDEDDRVRQSLLAYRNYRLAAYEIIFRYRHYAAMPDEPCRLRCFLLAYGAALPLYAKSLKIIQVAEHHPLLRAKLNEPDSKFDLESGFFDDVLAGYSSLANYRAIWQADWFWRFHRRAASALAREAGPAWSWLPELICHLRHVIRKRLFHVLLARLRYDWRAFWKTTLQPARQARHGLEVVLGRQFAGVHLTGEPAYALHAGILSELRPCLRPGDVLLSRSDGRLTAALLPGFWTHASLFLGAPLELEAMGLRQHPHAARYWSEAPAVSGRLGTVIEALCPCVRLNPLERCLEADHVVALRPNLPAPEVAAAIGEALGHLGKPYDFEFDFNVSTRLVCTELVYRTYHHRGPITFSLTKRLGRFTLTGDDIVGQTLDHLEEPSAQTAAPFQPVALVLKRRDGLAHLTPTERILPLLRRIRRGWRPARRAPEPTPG